AIFADTLPDDFGNAVIDAWLARQGRDPASFTALERLLYTGNRGMGALEYAPAMRRDFPPGEQLELNSLIAMAQRILDQRSAADIRRAGETDDHDAMKSLFQVGTSAGGARAKALVAVSPDRARIRSGQVEAPQGYEHFLLKFDGVEEHRTGSQVFGDPKGYGRMEYAYYLMARDAELDISPSELLLDGPRAHFMTRRFDRDGNRKLHYASLCAVDHADYKKPGAYSYEQLLAVARRLRLSRRDAVEIYRRMVFNVVARNHDDHSKNIGFLLDAPGQPWRLAPAFDIAYSYKRDSPWVNAHQLSLNGKRDDFRRQDLLAVAELIGNFRQQAREIIDLVVGVVARWPEYAQRAGVSEALAGEIQDNLRLYLGSSR
ncbi:MAG: type II toxin-antitoxin system HipA family toxin, partial [Bacteroidales bacterium]|nr:type II toxin-antitoxin system HipA family toxin [Bacteroidales bacterium]